MITADLNLHHVRLFWEVARSGGLRAASEKLHLSQPTISAQIKSLEAALGQPLFDRTGRGMKVNAAGQLLMDHAGELFALASEMVRSLQGHGGVRALKLNLGLMQSLPKLAAWQLIRPAIAAVPNLQLTCTEGNAPELFGMLVSGRLDAILADEPAPASLRVKAFSKRVHRAGCVFCATPEAARRLRRGFPKSLDGAPALLPAERTPWRHRVERWFESVHVRPRIVAEFDDAALMKTAAADGLGFAPVLESVVAEAISRYGLAPIGSAPEAGLSAYVITVERTSRHRGVVALTAGAREAG